MKKAIIITAIVLTVLGAATLAGALIISGGNLSKFAVGEYETNTYTVDGDFKKIAVATIETDVEFRPSEDGKTSVVCKERKNVKHIVKIESDSLAVIADDQREWYDYFSFFHKRLTMTVYLPSEKYEALKIDCGTGEITISDKFSFSSAEITASTGDVRFAAAVDGPLKVETSTGDIELEKVSAKKIALTVSTGDMVLSSLKCEGAISADVSTGRITMTDVECASFVSTGSTGNVSLKNVIASESISVDRSTGDVRFDGCDAEEIRVETSTGDVSGSLLSEKVFVTKSSTGSINVPDSVKGGRCEISTTTGDIDIRLK